MTEQRRWIGFERTATELKLDRWLTDRMRDSNVVLRVNDLSHASKKVQAAQKGGPVSQ